MENNIIVKKEYSVTRGESFNHDGKTNISKDGAGSVAASIDVNDTLDGKSTFLNI
jgi:hypothetical protein